MFRQVADVPSGRAFRPHNGSRAAAAPGPRACLSARPVGHRAAPGLKAGRPEGRAWGCQAGGVIPGCGGQRWRGRLAPLGPVETVGAAQPLQGGHSQAQGPGGGLSPVLWAAGAPAVAPTPRHTGDLGPGPYGCPGAGAAPGARTGPSLWESEQVRAVGKGPPGPAPWHCLRLPKPLGSPGSPAARPCSPCHRRKVWTAWPVRPEKWPRCHVTS